MPPHQPVPITATSICCTLVSPVFHYRIPANLASAMPIPGCRAEKDHSPAPRQPERGGSIRMQPVLLDHLGPLGGFDVHIGLEVLGGLAADGDHAALAHARLNLRLG